MSKGDAVLEGRASGGCVQRSVGKVRGPFSLALFRVLEMEWPNYPRIWEVRRNDRQGLWRRDAAVALDPLRHRFVVLERLLGKVRAYRIPLRRGRGRAAPLLRGLTALRTA